MMEEVTFDGVCLSDYYIVAGIERPNASVVTETQEVLGMDGLAVTGSHLGANSLRVHLMLADGDMRDRRDALRELYSLLNMRDVCDLYIGSDNNLHYRAKLDGEQPVSSRVTSDKVVLNFMTPEPYLYGEEEQVTVPSGGSVTFWVDGTCVARPVIEGTASPDSEAGAWGLVLDDADMMRVEMSDSSSVVIDCLDGHVTVGGDASMLTLPSDWFELSPGEHTIENDLGTGSCTVRWCPVWL